MIGMLCLGQLKTAKHDRGLKADALQATEYRFTNLAPNDAIADRQLQFQS